MNRNVLLVAKRFRCSATIFTISLFSMLLLTQCFAKRPSMTTGVVDRVVLMGTLASFQQQAGVNAPAGIARAQFRGMAPEINEIMSSYVDTLHHAVAANLRTQLGCEVIYGKELQSLPKYGELRESYERADALISVDEHFPEVYISSGDFNFIVTESNPGVVVGFGGMVTLKPDEIKQTVSDICSELNVKYLAYAHFRFTGYKMYLVAPNEAIIYYGLSIYNQDGDLIAASAGREGAAIKDGQPEVFQMLLDQYLAKSEQLEIKASKVKK